MSKKIKLCNKLVTSLLIVLLSLIGVTSASSAQSASPQVRSTKPGYDWTLPDYVTPTWGTGLKVPNAQSDAFPHKMVTLDWQTLNPEKGTYDWSDITDELAAAQQGNYGVTFRLKNNAVEVGGGWPDADGFVPLWVVTEANPRIFSLGSHKYAAPWDTQQLYLDFIDKFGQQNFHQNPHFFGMYINAFSTSSGEEFSFESSDISKLESAGMTADVLENTFEERIDAWVQAFGDEKGKLIWIGDEGNYANYITDDCESWPGSLVNNRCTIGERIAEHARNLGVGIRGGFLENYHYHIDPKYGQYLDNQGYLTINENSVLFSDDRKMSDELEEFERDGVTGELRTYMLRNALLRALQMRLTSVWMNSSDASYIPELAEYFNKSAGKKISSTADAWVALREAEFKTRGECNPVKNFERWLHQRDAVGYETTRARFYSRGTLSGHQYDCDASSTNSAGYPDPHGEFTARSSSSKIGFYVDQEFVDSSAIDLKVTYFEDASPAQWHIDYCGSSGESISTPVITENATNSLKTVTISLPDFAANRCLDSQFDFSITVNQGEAVVEFVRLVKDPENYSPSPSPSLCPHKEDLNQDNIVNILDYSILAGNFFSDTPNNSRSDINKDGKVDIADYSLLVSSLFKKCSEDL